MKRENFYRRNPGDALAGMVGMSLEERGVYNTIIDLIYLTWRPLEDSRQYIAGHCGCAVQKLNPIIDRLIARGKLLRFEEEGVWYLSNRRFEDERSEVKGPAKTRSGRGKVGEKSAGVGEKSAVLSGKNEENQSVKPLDRQERQENKEANASSVASAAPTATIGALALPLGEPDPERRRGEPWDRDPDFGKLWDTAPPLMRKRAKSKAKVWPEWVRAKKLALPAAILAGFDRYKTLDRDLPRSGGPGLHIWLKDRTWEFWTCGEVVDPTVNWTDAEWTVALRLWREDGEWSHDFGPPPGQPGCRAPARLLVAPADAAVGGAR